MSDVPSIKIAQSQQFTDGKTAMGTAVGLL